MSHDEERRAEAETYISPYRAVTRALATLASEEMVITLLGYFDVNSIAVRGKGYVE